VPSSRRLPKGSRQFERKTTRGLLSTSTNMSRFPELRRLVIIGRKDLISSRNQVAGVGAVSLKVNEIHGGSTHHGITMMDITPAIFGQEFALPRPDRKRKCEAMTLTLSPETSRPCCVDRRAPTKHLIDCLEAGAQCPKRTKGWRPAKLSLNDGEKMKRGKLVMNHIERQQLLVEVIMLEQHLANRANRTEKTQHARSKKFKKRSRVYDALTTKYLVVQIAWGLGNQYLSRLPVY
jgi:hypothetical protein